MFLHVDMDQCLSYIIRGMNSHKYQLLCCQKWTPCQDDSLGTLFLASGWLPLDDADDQTEQRALHLTNHHLCLTIRWNEMSDPAVRS